jgi:superfamily II DNA/RNA helicase
MPLKKLHSDLHDTLAYLEIETPTSFQRKTIPIIKSGANVYCTATENSGKTTTLIPYHRAKIKM